MPTEFHFSEGNTAHGASSLSDFSVTDALQVDKAQATGKSTANIETGTSKLLKYCASQVGGGKVRQAASRQRSSGNISFHTADRLRIASTTVGSDTVASSFWTSSHTA